MTAGNDDYIIALGTNSLRGAGLGLNSKPRILTCEIKLTENNW